MIFWWQYTWGNNTTRKLSPKWSKHGSKQAGLKIACPIKKISNVFSLTTWFNKNEKERKKAERSFLTKSSKADETFSLVSLLKASETRAMWQLKRIRLVNFFFLNQVWLFLCQKTPGKAFACIQKHINFKMVIRERSFILPIFKQYKPSNNELTFSLLWTRFVVILDCPLKNFLYDLMLFRLVDGEHNSGNLATDTNLINGPKFF